VTGYAAADFSGTAKQPRSHVKHRENFRYHFQFTGMALVTNCQLFAFGCYCHHSDSDKTVLNVRRSKFKELYPKIGTKDAVVLGMPATAAPVALVLCAVNILSRKEWLLY